MGKVDYKYYSETYGGSLIPESEFSNCELKAEAEVNCFTFGRFETLKALSETVKNCVCDVAEQLYKRSESFSGAYALSSFSNDGVSGTYADDMSNAGFEAALYQCVFKHLGHSGLMYRGIMLDE